MNPTSIVIGMGIGSLYKSVLKELGHDVVTVDSDINKGANFPTVVPAIFAYKQFDTAHICTPNFTHYQLTETIAPNSKLVFIEKPGLRTSGEWQTVLGNHKSRRIMMVKNNMWRDEIPMLQELASRAKRININWINKNRVPGPGTWFTNKKYAFGGVSRDLMPHLLSIFIALNPQYKTANEIGRSSLRKWELEDLLDTEYGVVDPKGTYDVDDYCSIIFDDYTKSWHLTADWKDGSRDQRNIEFIMSDGSVETFELGLCPENAYKNMIREAKTNLNNNTWWEEQYEQDFWIHTQVEKF